MTVSRLLSAQIRAARALLKWSAADLARHSALGVNTVRRAETADEGTSLTAANELAIRRTFEAAGVEFTNGDQPGVRLAKAPMIRSAGESAGSSSVAVIRKITGARNKKTRR
jgi:chemotaxis response regulator CheB